MARISAFATQIDIAKSNLLGPARKQFMVEAARSAFAEAQATNARILGREPPFTQVVDGRTGAALETVKSGGTIVFLFDVAGGSLQEAVNATLMILRELSPIDRDAPDDIVYRNSHQVLVNNEVRSVGSDLKIGELKPEDEVQITNLLPYSRRLERGWSSQAPNGIYNSAFKAIDARYGKVLIMKFTYAVFPGFEVGKTKKGGAPTSRSELRRAASYPTITMRAR